MNLLKHLGAQVLIGSERRPPELPKTQGALAELLTSVGENSTAIETQLLRAAGAITIYTQTGFQPPQNAVKNPPVCDDEKLIVLKNENLIDALQNIIKDGPRLLLLQFLTALTEYQQIIPAKLLPELLNLGKTYPKLAQKIPEVCGARGLWLAQFNSDWSYLVDQYKSVDQDLWENGQQEQRLLFIKNLRARDPQQARELIAHALPELDARDRATLIGTLQDQLTSADEAFIESQLSDRSKEVRTTAASLLSALPKSQFVQRMQQRLLGCLTQERKLFRRHWQLTAPDSFASDWAADTIDEKRPQSEALGEKAWWLFQLARTIPLNWWERTTELSADDLIAWALDSDWSLALLRAWYHALVREKNSVWAEAFLKKMPFKNFQIDGLELIGFLPLATRETYWLALLNGESAKNRRGEFVAQIVTQTTDVFSEQFSKKVITNIKKHLNDDSSKWDYPLRQSLVDFVCLIPASCFSEATQGWPMDSDKLQFFTDTIARLLNVIEQRNLLIQFLASEPS